MKNTVLAYHRTLGEWVWVDPRQTISSLPPDGLDISPEFYWQQGDDKIFLVYEQELESLEVQAVTAVRKGKELLFAL